MQAFEHSVVRMKVFFIRIVNVNITLLVGKCRKIYTLLAGCRIVQTVHAMLFRSKAWFQDCCSLPQTDLLYSE